MNQESEESKKANVLHKEKERMRHHRQVKLLNEVMELVPVSSRQAKTKVKKLRLLVLYTHYLKIIHAQATQRYCSSTIEDNEKCVNEEVSYPLTQSEKVHVCDQERKSQRAHIVFLHADKSVNQKKTICERPLSSDHTEIGYRQESIPVNKFGYAVPDVAEFNGRITTIDSNQEDSFPPKYSSNIEVNANVPISFDEYVISPHSIFRTPVERKYTSSISTEDQLSNEKENSSPIATCYPIGEKNFENISAQIVERFTPNMIINDRNLVDNHYNNSFHEISQRYPDNYILRDLTFTSAINKSLDNNNAHTSAQSREYLLNSCEGYLLQDIPSVYEYQVLQENFPCESSLLPNNNLYLTDYFVNSQSLRPQSYNSFSFIEDNMSGNSNSSTSTDKLNIDIENSTDSNPSYANLSESPSSLNANYSGSPSQLYCDNMNLPDKQVLPGYNAMKQEHKQGNSNIIPSVSLISNHSENPPVKNDVFTPLSHSCHAYPTNFRINRNHAVILPPESVHSLPSRNIQCSFVSDSNSLYSPSFENLHSGSPLPYTKPEMMHLDESFPNSTKSSFFEDEASFSLTQYFKE